GHESAEDLLFPGWIARRPGRTGEEALHRLRVDVVALDQPARLLQRGGLGSGLQPVEARPALVGGRRGACASLLDAVLDAVGDAVHLHELAAPLVRERDAPALLAAGEGPARASGQAGADLQAAAVHLDAEEVG